MNQETKSPFPTSDTMLKAQVVVVGDTSASAAIIKKLSQFGIVAAMNIAFGNPQGLAEDFLPMPDVSTAKESHYDLAVWTRLENQCKSISDEINEFQEAVAGADWLGLRDALCDVKVFAYGGAHFMGYNIDGEPAKYPAAQYEHWAASFFRRCDPVTALRAAQSHLMYAIVQRNANEVQRALQQIIYVAEQSAGKMGVSPAVHEADMYAVVDGVMTRFIKDDADKAATIAKHAAKGVTDVYFEGEYPVMIMKSASAQPDAPAGKFLKSASFKEAAFAEAPYDVDAAGMIIAAASL